jgi:hypothetical protein
MRDPTPGVARDPRHEYLVLAGMLVALALLSGAYQAIWDWLTQDVVRRALHAKGPAAQENGPILAHENGPSSRAPLYRQFGVRSGNCLGREWSFGRCCRGLVRTDTAA